LSAAARQCFFTMAANSLNPCDYPQIYGRMNAPATIDAIYDLMAAKGGGADDIGKLSKGEFYFSTEGSLRPFKVRTSLCLSWHPPNPPTAEEVVKKARSTRA
jgi:hypothetical protein